MSKAPQQTTIDGFPRTAKQERQINLMAVSTFGTAPGREFLSYLRSISIESVGGPHISTEELRFREGCRYFCYLIEQRVAQGHKEKQNAEST